MKLWLTGLTTKGQREHLQDLIEPIKQYFDGFVWVFHDDCLDARITDDTYDQGYNYLTSLPKSKVILSPWCNRFDFSRNIGLYHGPIRYGDWFVVIDTMERMDIAFAARLKELIHAFNQSKINGAYIRNKHFLFQYNESTSFVSNPHCGVAGVSHGIEITNLPFWKDEYWRNVRSEYRDPFHFVEQNLKYYLFPRSNHLILKCENDQQFIQDRYTHRATFLDEMLKNGIDIEKIEEVRQYLIKGQYSECVKECINAEKYLNDFVRFHVLKQKDFIEDFDFKNLITIS
jgi:hypothetical protein